jgi:hypothetical protein
VVVHAHEDQVIDDHPALPHFQGRLGTTSQPGAISCGCAIQNFNL